MTVNERETVTETRAVGVPSAESAAVSSAAWLEGGILALQMSAMAQTATSMKATAQPERLGDSTALFLSNPHCECSGVVYRSVPKRRVLRPVLCARNQPDGRGVTFVPCSLLRGYLFGICGPNSMTRNFSTGMLGRNTTP